MFFDKDKKIGRDLAMIVIMLSEEQVKDEIITNRQFSEIETYRLRFCLTILNVVAAMWWVNLYERVTNRVKKITDSMCDTFMEFIEYNSSIIKMGDLIVDPTEKNLIRMDGRAIGINGINDNTGTSLETITPIIYNSRVVQYSNALSEVGGIILKDKSFNHGPHPAVIVTKLFIKHFTGKELENLYKSDMFWLELSIWLGANIISIGDTVKRMLKK